MFNLVKTAPWSVNAEALDHPIALQTLGNVALEICSGFSVLVLW